MIPHPEHAIARRITELERRALPAGVMVWPPRHSASGQWEAADSAGWEIALPDPVAFADELEARLAGPVPGEPK